MNGAVAGGIAALVWAAVEPADKRAFDVDYSDVELLGKFVTRDEHWPAVGLAIHAANGALFGAAYAYAKPFIPGPPVLRGTLAGLAENFATWPLTQFIGRVPSGAQEDPPTLGLERRRWPRPRSATRCSAPCWGCSRSG